VKELRSIFKDNDLEISRFRGGEELLLRLLKAE
jgi:hypothetical protein